MRGNINFKCKLQFRREELNTYFLGVCWKIMKIYEACIAIFFVNCETYVLKKAAQILSGGKLCNIIILYST